MAFWLGISTEQADDSGEVHQPTSGSRSPRRVNAYNPDTDDYDPCTAPVLPPLPSEVEDELTRKQIAALRSRISQGGTSAVLEHYRRLVSELEQSRRGVTPVQSVSKPELHTQVSWQQVGAWHKRVDSCSSDLSTRYPDDEAPRLHSGSEEEEELDFKDLGSKETRPASVPSTEPIRRSVANMYSVVVPPGYHGYCSTPTAVPRRASAAPRQLVTAGSPTSARNVALSPSSRVQCVPTIARPVSVAQIRSIWGWGR